MYIYVEIVFLYMKNVPENNNKILITNFVFQTAMEKVSPRKDIFDGIFLFPFNVSSLVPFFLMSRRL